MWKELSPQWQAAFEEAWTAFGNGSIPIGAVITDESGTILIREHNRAGEPDTVNRLISHAEANALRRLDTARCNVRSAVLYTTMEPCPMCMGTAVMSNIKHLRYASCDPYCGSVYLKNEDPYISGKVLDYVHEGGEPQLVQLVIQSYYELRSEGRGDHVLRRFEELSSSAVAAARELYREKKLDSYVNSGADMAFVYDSIIAMINNDI
ncbi:nucleoside deaminase [uncultured Ruminococcus sp.]|uniref:nucleoside deaminase n=1 Tax=uncultured Ruminococcus sp. TaxID=165186 RepID=UPI002617917B|nr:nucleoside deaminase [uncultured Ruminococcus sp.]